MAYGNRPLAAVTADLPVGRGRMPPGQLAINRGGPPAATPTAISCRFASDRYRRLPGRARSPFSPPACRNHASAARPAPQPHPPSGPARRPGRVPECESRTALVNGSRPLFTATTFIITEPLRGSVESARPIGRGTRSALGHRWAGRFRIRGLPAEFWPRSLRRSAPSIHRATGSGRRHRRAAGRRPGVPSPRR
jgi:hypothetical protein